MKSIVLRKIDYLRAEDFTYGKIPQRMMYLRDVIEGPISDPTFTAWRRLKQIHSVIPLVFTDIYRSPASSAEAYARKTGVAKPGYSGHNYGVSVDLAIDATMKRHTMDYNTLCRHMIAFGWTPYQGVTSTSTYKRGKEDWHFNFIGDYASTPLGGSPKPGSDQMNQWINSNFSFPDDIRSIQEMLTKLRFYQGAIDGEAGPLTIEAIKKFKRAWLPSTFHTSSKLDETTARIINIVACDVEMNG